jgi:tetratricopeptide (TPR) repeat protein
MRIGVPLVVAALLVSVVPAAWSAGGNSMPSSNVPRMEPARELTPEERAKQAYNSGVRTVKKADKYDESSLKAVDPRKKEKSAKQAQERYQDALAKFELAVQSNPSMYEAWNYVGYTRRKLGNYDAALEAYDHALKLKPSYPEAIEYRGEAFLRLKRLDDAKQAYLDLFAGNRALADKLLGSMKTWVDTQRTAGADPASLEEFEKWVAERSQIAGQTAALTREGAGASWR